MRAVEALSLLALESLEKVVNIMLGRTENGEETKSRNNGDLGRTKT